MSNNKISRISLCELKDCIEEEGIDGSDYLLISDLIAFYLETVNIGENRLEVFDINGSIVGRSK